MKKKKVLLVEDEPTMSIVLRDTLRRDGVEVVCAKNGVDGLAVAKQNRPNLILLDILMPKMDGLAMLAELRKDPWGKTAEVVILTNYIDSEKQRAASLAGVKDYWPKTDLSLEEIVGRVQEKLANG